MAIQLPLICNPRCHAYAAQTHSNRHGIDTATAADVFEKQPAADALALALALALTLALASYPALAADGFALHPVPAAAPTLARVLGISRISETTRIAVIDTRNACPYEHSIARVDPPWR